MKAQRTPTVLFVDDDVDLTRGIALALRREPFRVLTSNDPLHALELVAKERIDVVVSDDQMPEMGGAELLSAIRARHPHVVRILLTGQTDIRRAASAINDAEVFRFLLKPFDRALLVSTLGAAFSTAESLAPTDRREEGLRFDAALEQLWMAQQPIYDRTGHVAGFELLMRSAAPDFGGPEHLIGMAKVLDRCVELDRSVGDRAVFLAAALGDHLIFVNVDPPSLSRGELFAPLLPHARHIVLEITERDARGEPKALARRIGELKALGFKVAVDDLGSGHAGLNSVVDLSPDIVKLDMNLIRDVDASFVKQRLVRSVCDAARDLSIRVVAEGIERVAELDATYDAGCDYFQGYLLGRPGRAPVVSRWPRGPSSEAATVR